MEARPGLLTVFLCLLGAVAFTHGDYVALSIRARDRAKRFLLSKIDPDTKTFPVGERAAGVLGMIAFNPFGNATTEEEKLQRQLEVQSMAVDFLQMINHIQRKYPADPPLKHVDDSTLLKYLAALRGRCLNGRDFHGHDLMAEVFRRVDGDTSLYGGMILALCNAGERYTKEQILKLAQVKNCPTCQFHNEEVAMNLLAATCIVTRRDEEDYAKDSTDAFVISKLINNFAISQQPDGSFGGSFIGTALALQVLNRVPSKLPASLDLDASVVWLTNLQKADGSFGSSVEFTSLAVPAFTGQTLADLRMVRCPRYTSNTATVSFIVEDMVVSKQRLRDHFIAPLNSIFLRGLGTKSNENKATFSILLQKTYLGINIVSVNGLKNTETAAWKVFRIEKNGDETDITRTLEREIVRGDSVYKLSFVITAAS